MAARLNLSVSAEMLRVAFEFVGATPKWPVLECVRVEKHAVRGATIIATDGKLLLVQYDETAKVRNDINLALDTTDWTKLKDSRELIYDSEGLYVMRGEHIIALDSFRVMQKANAPYPKWRKLLPADLSKMRISVPAMLDAGYLKKLSSLYLTYPGYAAMRFYGDPEKPLGPALIEFPQRPQMVAVLAVAKPSVMEAPAYLPEWLTGEDPAADL
jgi:hypothetical protein